MTTLDYYKFYCTTTEPNESEGADPNTETLQENLAKMISESCQQLPEGDFKETIGRLVQYLQNPTDGLEILRINKRLRNTKFSYGNIELKFPQINKKVLSNEGSDIHKLVNDALANSTFPFRDTEAYFDMMGRANISILSNFENEISRISDLADFVGATQESLKKSTAFNSKTTDLKHLVFGLRCKFFVSADKACLERARFIARWLNLPVKIFNVDQFVEYCLIQILESAKKRRSPVTFQFAENGVVIRSYTIDFGKNSGV